MAGKSCQIIHFDLFYDSNHLFFYLFQFVLGYRLYRFDLATNRITKSTIRPSLLATLNFTSYFTLTNLTNLNLPQPASGTLQFPSLRGIPFPNIQIWRSDPSLLRPSPDFDDFWKDELRWVSNVFLILSLDVTGFHNFREIGV